MFSIANIRALLPLMYPIALKLKGVLISQITDKTLQPSSKLETGVEIDILPWMSRSALEYISQACLGYSFNALEPKKTGDYASALRNFASVVCCSRRLLCSYLHRPAILRVILLRPMLPFVMRTFPLSWRMAMLRWLPFKGLKELTDIVNIMDETHRRIFAEKVATVRRGTDEYWDDEGRREGDMSAHMRGRDMMTVMRKSEMGGEQASKA